jgi:hypothetical protein
MAKRSTNHPATTYLFIPSYKKIETRFFELPEVHTITGYSQISWQPIYNMINPVALPEETMSNAAKHFFFGLTCQLVVRRDRKCKFVC